MFTPLSQETGGAYLVTASCIRLMPMQANVAFMGSHSLDHKICDKYPLHIPVTQLQIDLFAQFLS
jgi:hypothetical protein